MVSVPTYLSNNIEKYQVHIMTIRSSLFQKAKDSYKFDDATILGEVVSRLPENNQAWFASWKESAVANDNYTWCQCYRRSLNHFLCSNICFHV